MTEIILLGIVALAIVADVNILLYYEKRTRKEVANERSRTAYRNDKIRR